MFRNLNAEVARFGLTNEKVSEILGMSRKTYEIKKSTGSFTLAEAKKLAKHFGVSLDYLFETADERGDE